MRLYLIAIQFLTIIPLPFKLRWEKDDLARSMALFPLAGLTIGAILAGVDWLIGPFLSRPLTDALLITALALITGALHLDGLADVCDGIAARGSRERFMEIMKDSRVGAVGVVGVVLGLLLKWQAMIGVPEELKWQALLLFPAITRFCQVQSIVFGRNARQDGLGSTLVSGAGKSQFLIAAILAGTFSWLLLGINGIAVLLAAMLSSLLIQAWFNRKIGGITGDVIGCTNELNEILVLILLSALPQIRL
jgi:adenosylcobinamide-GDP ribazoletransferase